MMKSPVVGFKAVERVETVVNTLRDTTHNGFPVFPADRQAPSASPFSFTAHLERNIHNAVLCCAVLCCAVPCCAVLCRAVLCCAVP